MTDIFKLVKDVQEIDSHKVGHSCLSQKSVYAEEADSFKKDIQWLFRKYSIQCEKVNTVFTELMEKFVDFDSGLSQDLASKFVRVRDSKDIRL